MSTTITSAIEIPDAPVYVMANDSFMSGWGQAAGKTNTVILPCASWQEAEIVAENARNRTDQKNVRIVIHKPRIRPHVLYSLMDRTNAGRWYTPGGFTRHND